MITLSIPGKTFLCGEYLALIGGPTVLLSTSPSFQMHIANRGEIQPAGLQETHFHPASPAGRLLAKHQDRLSSYRFYFESPYGAGGFGGSTAEYLALATLLQLGEGLKTEYQIDLDVRQALNEYRELHTQETVPPSGADLVSQACGWVTGFAKSTGRIQVFSWSFKTLGFCLFSTGTRLATHEHLKNLKLASLESLNAPTERVLGSFVDNSEEDLLAGLTEVSEKLASLGLQTETTLNFRSELLKLPGARVVKGCGAMGADVVLVIYDKNSGKNEIIQRAWELGMSFVADEDSLASGITKLMPRHLEEGLSL